MDIHRSVAPDFQVGQQVYVKAQFISTTRPSKKLSEKFIGPYSIISKAGSNSFILKLPNHMHAVHPVFHVSMLEPAIPNQVQSLLPSIVIDGEPKYEISEILNTKLDN